MTYDEVRKTEAGYLASNNKVFREYGKVLKYFLDKYNSYAKNYTSDDLLFSDIAEKYIELQKHEMSFVKNNEDYKLRIRFASKYIIRDFVSKKRVLKLLKDYDDKEWTYEKVDNFLKKSFLYSRIKASTIESIIEDKTH